MLRNSSARLRSRLAQRAHLINSWEDDQKVPLADPDSGKHLSGAHDSPTLSKVPEASEYSVKSTSPSVDTQPRYDANASKTAEYEESVEHTTCAANGLPAAPERPVVSEHVDLPQVVITPKDELNSWTSGEEPENANPFKQVDESEVVGTPKNDFNAWAKGKAASELTMKALLGLHDIEVTESDDSRETSVEKSDQPDDKLRDTFGNYETQGEETLKTVNEEAEHSDQKMTTENGGERGEIITDHEVKNGNDGYDTSGEIMLLGAQSTLDDEENFEDIQNEYESKLHETIDSCTESEGNASAAESLDNLNVLPSQTLDFTVLDDNDDEDITSTPAAPDNTLSDKHHETDTEIVSSDNVKKDVTIEKEEQNSPTKQAIVESPSVSDDAKLISAGKALAVDNKANTDQRKSAYSSDDDVPPVYLPKNTENNVVDPERHRSSVTASCDRFIVSLNQPIGDNEVFGEDEKKSKRKKPKSGGFRSLFSCCASKNSTAD